MSDPVLKYLGFAPLLSPISQCGAWVLRPPLPAASALPLTKSALLSGAGRATGTNQMSVPRELSLTCSGLLSCFTSTPMRGLVGEKRAQRGVAVRKPVRS